MYPVEQGISSSPRAFFAGSGPGSPRGSPSRPRPSRPWRTGLLRPPHYISAVSARHLPPLACRGASSRPLLLSVGL